jgi:hypothetical protein
MHPAISMLMAQARIAHLHGQARRDALADTARRGRNAAHE